MPNPALQVPNLHPLTAAQVRLMPRGVPTLLVPCPACGSAPGYVCSAPDDRGRHDIRTLHDARVPRVSFPSRFAVGEADEAEGYGAAL